MLRLPWYAFFCRETAAELRGIPLPMRVVRSADLHVGVRAGRRRVDARGIEAHHLTLVDGDVVIWKGIRMTSVARTWIDLAAVLTLSELVAAGDAVLWRKHPLSTRARLRYAVDAYSGRRGVADLRRALPLLTDRADSPPESELRVAILEAGLPAPEINAPVSSPDGAFVAQPDLSWRRYRTALEYEGDHHRVDRSQWFEDIRRINELQKIRWAGIRASASDYRDPRNLIEQLTASLFNGGWDGRRIRHWC